MSIGLVKVVDAKQFIYTDDGSVRVVSWDMDSESEPFPTYVERFDDVIQQWVRIK